METLVAIAATAKVLAQLRGKYKKISHNIF